MDDIIHYIKNKKQDNGSKYLKNDNGSIYVRVDLVNEYVQEMLKLSKTYPNLNPNNPVIKK